MSANAANDAPEIDHTVFLAKQESAEVHMLVPSHSQLPDHSYTHRVSSTIPRKT